MVPSHAPVDPAPRASAWPEEWRGLVDDAAIFPPGDEPLHDATAAHTERRGEWWADLVGSFVLRDTDLPLVRGFGAPLSVVVTGGAGQLAGPLGVATRLGLQVAAVEIAVRDVDDPVGNVRRIDAALRAAEVDVPLFIELPGPATAAWLSRRRRGRGLRAPPQAAPRQRRPRPGPRLGDRRRLDRRRARPRDPLQGHGRAAPRRPPRPRGRRACTASSTCWPRRGRCGTAARSTTRPRSSSSATAPRSRRGLADGGVAAARRWFTSFGSCSVTEPLDDLIALGLVEDPA